MIKNLFSDSAVMAASITGIVAFIGIIFTSANYIYQNSQKNKKSYLAMLEKRLQYFYAPLYLHYSVDINYMITKDKDIMFNVKNYSYLVDVKIRKLLSLIIEAENKIVQSSLSVNSSDYTTLLDKLHKYKTSLFIIIENEYSLLSTCYERVYKDIDHKYRNSIKDDIENTIRRLFKSIALLFFTLLTVISAYKFFIKKGSTVIIQEIILPIMLVISLFGIVFFIENALTYIYLAARKSFLCYIPNEIVPTDGEYKCLYCGNIEHFYANTLFQPCINNSQKHRFVFKYLTMWKKVKKVNSKSQ